MFCALLPTRAIIRLSGQDVLSFLQGLVTNDVMRLPKECAQYAALLTPQGKFLHGFFLYWQDGDVLLDTPAGRAQDLLQRLAMYRLRSRVVVAPEPEMTVAACWGGKPPCPADALCVADPRLADMGWRMVGMSALLQPVCSAGEGDYQLMRLNLGMVDEADLTPEKSFPLQFGFEQLHAVDFRKGCYVGQEVTARTKHLGRLSKMVYRVTGAALPAQGTVLMLGDKKAGEMLTAAGHSGLALLDSEVLQEANTLAYAGGMVSVSLASWFKNSPAA